MPDTAKQSRRVGWFLAGLLVAIIVEIAVDWNATFYEINVLRAALQQKGENYADIMRQAATDAMLSYDWDALDRLSARLFDDDDVIYVRFTDVLGNTIYDRLRVDYGNEFKKKRGTSFRVQYRRPMDRDARGIMSDPLALRARYEASRHKDIIQKFNDLQMAIVRRFAAPKAGPEEVGRTLYQDRLAEKEGGGLDRTLSYSVGAVTNELGDPFGTILIAFRNDRLNSGTRMKLWKGTVITLFFVGLIIFQNLGARRSKLRLQALERALGAARDAIASTEQLPTADSGLQLHRVAMTTDVGGSLCVARQESGRQLVLLAAPRRPGIDAAFGVVALAEAFAALAEGLPLDVAADALRAGHERSPLAVHVEMALLAIDAQSVTGLATPDVALWHGDRLVALEVPAGVARPRSFGAVCPFQVARTARVVVSMMSPRAVEQVLAGKRTLGEGLRHAWEAGGPATRNADAWIFIVAPAEPVEAAAAPGTDPAAPAPVG